MKKTIQELSQSIYNYLKQVDGSKFNVEKDFENDLRVHLKESEFDVYSQVELEPINEKYFSRKPGTKVPDLVIKVEEGCVPIELKFNNTIEEYEKDKTKIYNYVHNYQDVPEAQVLFLSNKDHEKLNNLEWTICPANKSYKYIYAVFATRHSDGTPWVTKIPNAPKMEEELPETTKK